VTPLAGQAARWSGRLLRWLAQAVVAVLMLSLLAAGALAWRLAQAPLDAPWLARRIERAAAANGEAVRVGEASLAWNGFRVGGAPLLLRLADVQANGTTTARMAEAELSFPVAGLLSSRALPDSVTLAGARANVRREADGSLAMGRAKPPGGSGGLDPAAMLRSLAQPGEHAGNTPPAWLEALQHVHVHDAELLVDDRQLGIMATLTPINIDLDRDPHGGVAGQLSLVAHAGDQSASLTAAARLHGDGTDLQVAVSAVDPATIARLSPALAAGSALDAPVTLSGHAELGPNLEPRHFHADVAVAAGTLHAGQGTAPVVSGAATLDGAPRAATAALRLVTAARPDAPTTLAGHVEAARNDRGIDATATLGVDQIDFADLPAEWPAGVGGPGTRPWITENIPVGLARNGRLKASLHAAADFSDVTLTAIDGALEGHDLTVSWLKPVPPVEHVNARLTVTDPNVIDIATDGGVQAGGSGGGVRLGRGHVRLTGIAGNHQFANIDADLAGPLADLLHTLSHPRLHLLDRQPIKLGNPAGALTGHLTVARLPLEEKVSLDDLAIRARAHLTGVHLGGVVAGRDVDRGVLDLAASNDGLSIAGSAQLAHVPSRLKVDMDFRAGPPSQVTQSAHVVATVNDRQLASLGLPAQDFLRGDSAVTVDARVRRGGQTDIVADLDLAAATITASRIAYAKPAGTPATAHVAVQLQHDAVVSVSSLRLLGRGVEVAGGAGFAAGRPETLQLDRVRLGLTDMHGSVRLPHGARGYDVRLSGPSLDLSGLLDSLDGGSGKAGSATPFALDLRFGRVLFGPGRSIEGLNATAEQDGAALRRANVSGGVGPARFQASVQPLASGRQLRVAADDLGAALRAAGVWDGLRGGRLRIDGGWDDGKPNPTLSGRAVLESFRVLDAPVVGRILKAATLYGLIDLLRGPGLGFTRLEAPFRYAGGKLALHNAGVFSPSLGATAQGSIDIAARRADISGTVVPAYFFNALPGRLPLVGRLFSPEPNGGLFAATYSMRGPLADPVIGVNPASVLAPGMLRRLLGLSEPPKP